MQPIYSTLTQSQTIGPTKLTSAWLGFFYFPQTGGLCEQTKANTSSTQSPLIISGGINARKG
jgi:hypothetical protein